jgi:outer membrane PBP1 activator LpoA protein
MSNPVTRHPAATFLLALLVTACGSQPTPKPPTPVAEPAPTEAPVTAAGEHTHLLESANRLLLQRRVLSAASILTEIQRSKLTPEEQAQVSLLWAKLYYLQGDIESALASLQTPQSGPGELSPESKWELQREYLQLLAASGEPLAAARTASLWLQDTSEPKQRAWLARHIWQQLQSSSLAQLNSEREATTAGQWRGWLELNLIAARLADSPDIQIAEIQLWRQQYPDHPMADSLPGGLELLEELAESTPQKVALLLPLSHALAETAQAVLDGYLAMQYSAAQLGWESQQLLVLDTDKYSDIKAAYQAALAMGAELVIGPLAKETLAQWQQPVAADSPPLLALNWLETQTENIPGLYQFGLAAEDEARQLAQLAFAEGARKALLIRPAGSWGDTMADAFEDSWRQLQGELRSIAVYSNRNDYSSSIKNALNLDNSEARARGIRQLMGVEIEFSPRRRRDIDSVFLLSGQPAEARSIKPLIAFHYAADLPVYATSHVFSGRDNPLKDRDLNGLRLVQMPWLLQRDKLRQTIEATGAKRDPSTMHALGADAFLLHARLQQLAASPHNSIRGYTGVLSMDQQGRIHRQLLPAQFTNGVPVPLAR